MWRFLPLLRLLPMLLLLPVLLLLDACAPGCAGLPGTRQVTAQLFMGGDVPDPAWRDFVDSEITPRFPDGLSVIATDGQWRNPAGQQIREHSRLLVIVMPRNPAAIAAVEAVAAAYRQRFSQQSVGVVFSDVCAAF